MFKLILVFGVWINPHQITHLQDYSAKYSDSGARCDVEFSGDDIKSKSFYHVKCVQVAEEINKQMEEK
tara:strand:- start:680 stop:883 length:204 start_codon:yes stop_codon:yes gene_type:complete